MLVLLLFVTLGFTGSAFAQSAEKVTPEMSGDIFMARKMYREAAEAYQEALWLDPDVFESRNTRGVLLQERSVEERAKFHYYLAKTYAKAGQNDRALQYIRMSIEEGFKEKKKFQEDPEFAKLRDLPEFKELMLLEPRVL